MTWPLALGHESKLGEPGSGMLVVLFPNIPLLFIIKGVEIEMVTAEAGEGTRAL